MSRYYTEEHGIIGNLRGKKLRVVDGAMEIRLKGNNWVRTYPSTTTIIGQLEKPALVQWAANETCEWIRQNCEEAVQGLYYVTASNLNDARFNFRTVSKDALQIGSSAHNAVELYLNTGVEPKDPADEVFSAFIAFLEWAGEHELGIIETEQRLVGDRWQGTCDLVCTLDGKKFVVDFKTSKQPKPKMGYPEWTYQLACYRSVIPECDGMGVLRLDKETGFPDWYDLSDRYEWGLSVFNRLTDLFYATKGE
jgi:hypothetical protein